MTRKWFSLLVILLLMLLSAAAAEQAGAPATATDLECAHEHTRTTIYFFDSPSYTAINGETHRVSGPAIVETVCEDCLELIATEEQDYAEEIRPHTFKRGLCALCGFRRPDAGGQSGKNVAEKTLYAIPDEETGLLTLTLTDADLSELEKDQITTVLVRENTEKTGGGAAVALNVAEVHEQTRKTGRDLFLEMLRRGDDSFFACAHLRREGEEEILPDNAGITLRFYEAEVPALKVSLAPVNGDILMEAPSIWDEKGYWSVQYEEAGTYFLLK